MNLPNKPHDRFFKSTFSDKRIAADYIHTFLPKKLTANLKLDSLALASTSYINSELEEFLSDVVYTCKYGEQPIRISLLFEHKSSPGGIIYLQLLRYLIEAWAKQPKQKEGLRIIIPIVVYHGNGEWKKRPFSTYFPGLDEELVAYIPQFDYLLTDLSTWSDEALMTLETGLLKNVLLILKHFKDAQYIQNHIDRLFWGVEAYLTDPSQKAHIDKFWTYLYRTNEHKQLDFRKMIEKLSKSLREEAMTIYEKAILEGRIEGKLEGKIEGKLEGEKAKENLFISNAIKQGFTIATIAQLTSLSEKEVKERMKELGL